MSSVAAIQQQQLSVALTPKKAPTTGNAWHWWSPEQISAACQSPLASVNACWPLLYDALIYEGILTRDVARGILGTVAVETAHTFLPVREAFWLPESWRAANLRYYPWYGRGFIQLTWESNYVKYGAHIGIDLTTNPDVAMQPLAAARVMAGYFNMQGVDDACNRQDWPEVRRLVQGAYAGLDTLLQVVHDLA